MGFGANLTQLLAAYYAREVGVLLSTFVKVMSVYVTGVENQEAQQVLNQSQAVEMARTTGFMLFCRTG